MDAIPGRIKIWNDSRPSLLSCDDTLGITSVHCRTPRFDFSLFFEQSVLSILPSALLLLVALPRALYLRRQSQKVDKNALTGFKATAYVTFVILQVVLVAFWAQYRGSSSRQVAIADATLRLVDALALGSLSYLEHNRSVRPSSVICVYLIISLLLDGVQCRTLWLIHGARNLAPIFTAALAIKTLLLILEAREKRSMLLGSWSHQGPESTSGIISRGFFWWLNGLFLRGFSSSLVLEDLYESDKELRSENLFRHIEREWARAEFSRFKNHRLLVALLNALKPSLLQAVPPRLCLMAFNFAAPFLVTRVIHYVEQERGKGEQSLNDGYILIVATGALYVGTALADGFFSHKLYRTMTMVRGALVSFICQHSVDLKAASSGVATGADALTLTGPDIDTICRGFTSIHILWSCPLEILIAMYLLWRQLGYGFIGPLIPIILSTVLMPRLAALMGPARKIWSDAIQTRVGTTSNLLGSVKEAKMLGMMDSFLVYIQSLRDMELRKSKSFRAFIALMNALGNVPPNLSPICTFGLALITSDRTLSVAAVFTSLSIMGLVMGPMSRLLTAFPSFTSSLTSYERIETFVKACDAASNERRYKDDDDRGEDPETAYQDSADGTAIDLQHAYFTMSLGEEPLLQDISLRVMRSTLTVITGKVGSGKSVLLQGILGETTSKGYVNVAAASMAYCGQTAWLQNASIRQNIVGFEGAVQDIDQWWYDTVVTACALDVDFANMAEGDETLVGSRGTTLSGGQKQRITLARALYARRQLLLADDVLSGLDTITQSHVWHKVFGAEGLLRQHGITTVLATHAVRFLEQADRIVVLDQGRILHQGTFTELRDALSLSELAVDGPSSDDETQRNQAQRAALTDSDRELENLKHAGETTIYWYYLRSVGWKLCVTGLTSAMTSASILPLAELWLKRWAELNDAGAHVSTGWFFGLYSALLLTNICLLGVDCLIMFVLIVPRSASNLHKILLTSTLRAPLSFFAATDTGDLVNRFSEDMSLVDRDLPIGLYTTVHALMNCAGSAVLILFGSMYMTVAIPVTVLFIYLLQKVYLRTSQQLRLLDLQSKAPLVTHLMGTTEGILTIRAFGWQDGVREASLRLLDTSQKPHYLLYCIQRWLNLVLGLFVGASAVLLVSLVVFTRSASAGGVAIAMINILGYNESLAHLVTCWTELETSLGAVSRLQTFERTTPCEEQPKSEALIEPPKGWPQKGHITMNDVTAYHSVGPQSVSVLRDVNIEIAPGQKMAVCGRTGSGKSSLLLTLFKLIDSHGVVRIDGIDIEQLAPDRLRSCLISVPQEPVLFPGSLRSNLVLHLSDDTNSRWSGRKAIDEDLISVLQKVELWESATRAGGLDGQVSDMALSHGQKQLLCLARAILRKDEGRVVILDEAMSAVDKYTESLMVKLLNSEFEEHTIVSVVHRLETIRDFDRLVVLDQGEVVRVGVPRDLVTEDGRLVGV